MPRRHLYSVLALAGALPFLAAAIVSLFGVGVPAPLGSAEAVALSYGLAIASFLCGAHWGTYLLHERDVPTNLFVTSNVVVVGVWLAFLLLSSAWALAAQIVAFGYLLYVDYGLLSAGVIKPHYFRVRSVATALVCMSLLVVLVLL